MAEEGTGAESGQEVSGLGIDPVAAALALGSANRSEADAFLRDQRALIADQRHHLREQITHLDLGIWEKRLGIALRLATLAVGLAVATGLSLLIWDSAQADGLIVDEFVVPPDLAAHGLTGQVVAGQLLGNLSDLQARSISVRAPSSFANNWGDGLKVEIPETGVSIGEVTRFLRGWIGHETHVSGAVIRTATGITINARVGSVPAAAVAGSEAEMDSLLEKLSQSIYRQTQPYRYALQFYTTYQMAEAKTALRSLAATGSSEDRFWAFNGLASLYATQNDWNGVLQAAQGALALRPNSFVPNFFLARSEFFARHDELALAAAKAAIASDRDSDILKQNWDAMRLATECVAASLQGDFQSSSQSCERAPQIAAVVSIPGTSQIIRVLNAAALHDAAATRAAVADLPTADTYEAAEGMAAFRAWTESLVNQSPDIIRRQTDLATFETNFSRNMRGIFANPGMMQPPVALAMALAGDMKGAHALIDKTPLDCNACLRTRGRIDALERNWAGAEYWFERAAKQAPSTPFPFTDWGRSRLDRGNADGAIEMFAAAHSLGPKFADPLEGWGEALMAKNEAHLALAKFAEAEKYAPNWGRLHLKWGEALVYAGKKEDAAKQFARAAALDLTPSEKAELASHAVAPNP